MALLRLIRGNLMECQKKINQADLVINFNGHCLINNNVSIPKKVINLYISYKLNPQLKI